MICKMAAPSKKVVFEPPRGDMFHCHCFLWRYLSHTSILEASIIPKGTHDYCICSPVVGSPPTGVNKLRVRTRNRCQSPHLYFLHVLVERG